MLRTSLACFVAVGLLAAGPTSAADATYAIKLYKLDWCRFWVAARNG